MRVPTPDGTLWFKAPDDATEAPLTALLATLLPDVVPEVVATDPTRGWMLLRDAGTRLREIIDADRDLGHWEAALPACAELQIAAMPRVDDLLAIGIPDLRLHVVPVQVEELLATPEFLMLDEPDALSTGQRDELVAAMPRIRTMCAELEAFGVPASIQHDDLNDGNVYVRDGRYRIMDWGDASVSHPFHTLTVALRATCYRMGLAPGGPEILRLRDAYLEPFAGYGSRDELVWAADTAYRTGTLARALAWWSYVAVRPPEERLPDLESVPYGLRKFLEHGAIGDWN
jgi:hypothetical protein